MTIKILKEIFYVLTAALLVFSGLEILWPNLILSYMNINLLLLVWLLVGIVILLSNEKKYE